ncbi:MAG: penicillin-binding protein 2 [Coriobacteriia bacterium]|nr:penicillin-binding protein 2 [Coriobacteriia bacterium]MCL2537546.1 penicillin-binding protein 2 [Coriobacteriia bacterium]
MAGDVSLNRRLLVLGGLVLLIGAALVFRLWTLQIIQFDQFADRADNNLRRIATTTAIRGRIFDRNGVELVTNRSTIAVMAPALRIDNYEQFDRLSEEQQAWVERVGTTLNLSNEEVVNRLTTTREGPLELRLLAIDVPMETVAYIVERSGEFAGVEVEARAVRQYPHGSVAAHVLGYTGNITEAEMGQAAFEGYQASDVVGKTGVERSFEHILQGVRGTRELEVNAQGRLQRVVSETEPTAGQDIYLTLDVNTQMATEQALLDAMSVAQRDGHEDATAASAVVMKVDTGEVLALASYPTYYPEEFIGGIPQDRWAELTDENSNFPLTNRAVSSMYPPASTFKSFMTMAAVDKLGWGPNTTHICTGTWTGFGEQWPWRCWLRTGHGAKNLYEANYNSCDIPFYEAGREFHLRGNDEIQDMARHFGYGSVTGIDLPGEARGRVPDAEWKAFWNRDFPEYRAWVAGDTVNLSIGQGDMLATPLQVAYSHIPIANGGDKWRPQLLHSIRDSRGDVIREVEPELAENQPEVSDRAITIIQNALRMVITDGTGRSAFRGFEVPVSGKTGTAETGRRDPITGLRDQDSHAWFVGYAPANNPQYVAVVMVEHGGGGGAIAAPAARQIFAQLFGLEEEWVTATDASR